MVRPFALSGLLAAVALSTSGCVGKLFGVNLFAVGEKSALEQQVLGTYEQVGRDLAVYASVRGVAPDGSLKEPPPITSSQQAAIQAMNNRRYNRDDLEVILLSGAVGEGNDGLLALLDENRLARTSLGMELSRQVIAEENADRRTLIDRLMLTTPGVTETDRPEVSWIFATLNQQLAPTGSSLQTRAGEWSTK
jgi:hypothetical protein